MVPGFKFSRAAALHSGSFGSGSCGSAALASLALAKLAAGPGLNNGSIELARALPVNVRSADKRACAEVLGKVLDTKRLLEVLLPVFFLQPRANVSLLKPDKRCRVCDGVPVGVGGLGILYTQFVNVGRGGRRGQIRGHSLDLPGWPLSGRPCKRAREWKRARAACRRPFSPYGRPRGCYAANA